MWTWLEEVFDPEVPVIHIVELGVVRAVDPIENGWKITITPTYSGCPAMEMIEEQIKYKLDEKGVNEIEVETVLTPAWTTDWITDEAREKLFEYGIAPPEKGAAVADKNAIMGIEKVVRCPQCKSVNTRLVSQFGSTACKAMYQCNDCLEPFDYFKCI